MVGFLTTALQRVIASGLFFILCACSGIPAFAGDLHGVRYLGCYDGDTCKVIVPYLSKPFTQFSVRLRGIDAPEIRGKCEKEKVAAREVKALTNRLMQHATTIDLIDAKLGLYGRIVADIVLDGDVNLGQVLFDAGVVVRSSGKRTKDWCE